MQFPLLPKRVTSPSGYSTYALYNANGKLTYRNADPVNGQTPEWIYRYLDSSYPDNLTSTTDAAGVTTSYTYAGIGGGALYQLVTSQQVGPKDSARVNFSYCVATRCFGQPSAILSAQNALGVRSKDSLDYDTRAMTV